MTKIIIILLFTLSLLQADVVEQRQKAHELQKSGNYKDAVALYSKLLIEFSDKKSGEDLLKASECYRVLGQHDAPVTLLEKSVAAHPKNIHLLWAAANIYRHHIRSNGSIKDGRFYRADYRGTRMNSSRRDRIRSLQLFHQAYLENKLLNTLSEKEKSEFLFSYAKSIRSKQASAFLQQLTNTKELPEYQTQNEFYADFDSNTAYAPTDEKGNPIFYPIPDSFDKATSDGERWRFILSEAAKCSADSKNRALEIYAQFLQTQFGVASLSSFSWFHSYSSNSDEENKGILTVHTLEDNETTTRLSSGVKRLILPAEHNHILIFKQLFKNGYSDGFELANTYLNRRQFTKAVRVIETSLERAKNKRISDMLNDIVDDWIEFPSNTVSFPAGKHPKLNLLYRNTKSLSLTIQPFDMSAYYKAQKEHVASNPIQLSYNSINWHNLDNAIAQGKHNKFLKKSISETTIHLNPRGGHWDTREDISIPIKKAGYYLLTATLPNKKKIHTLIKLDSITVVQVPVKDGTLFTVVDAISGKPLANSTIDFFGFLQNNLNKKQGARRFQTLSKSHQATANAQGQILIKPSDLDNKYRWSYQATKDQKSTILPFTYYDYNNRNFFNIPAKSNRSFAITDRPVYKPEQKVFGKFWHRVADYTQDAQSKFAKITFEVQAYDPLGEKFGKPLTVIANEYGGIEYELDLPKNAKLGVYRVALGWPKTNSFFSHQTFRVEKYKKPEFEVIVKSPTEPVTLGEEFEATVKAKYYHGAPVTDAKVKVKVMRQQHSGHWHPNGKWDWLYGRGYGWLGVNRTFYPGWHHWGCFAPRRSWWRSNYQQPELVFEQNLAVNNDGEVKVKIDSALAKEVFGEQNQQYTITAEVTDASRRTIVGSGSTLATAKPFQTTVWLNRGHTRTGEKITAYISANTIEGIPVSAEGNLELFNISLDEENNPKEISVAKWDIISNKKQISQNFRVNEAGQYKVIATLTDNKGNKITGATFITVLGNKTAEKTYAYNDLEITPDKSTYSVGETAKILIKSKHKDSHIHLFTRSGNTYTSLKLDGQSTTYEIAITQADMPNFFVSAFLVKDAVFHHETAQIIVPPEKRVLNVEVVANKTKVKPREKGTIKIKVTDENGNPVIGSVALSIYDKSIEYISAGSNVGNIKSTFWNWKRSYYDRFTHTLYLHSRNILPHNTKPMARLGVFGYQTGSFKLFEAGGSLADKAIAPKAAFGGIAEATTVTRKKVYHIKTKNRKQAQSSASQLIIRNNFADLVKWQGHVQTNANGIAEVPVEYPDSLTTWKIKTWALTHGTRVGEGSTEVITSKDLIIRLQAPRFFVEKDEVTLSAVVHNYHDTSQDAKVSLQLIGNTISSQSPLEQEIQLKANNGEKRVNWSTKVLSEGEAKIRMTVVTPTDSDAMELTFPVYVHGILKQEAWSQTILAEQNKTDLIINIPEQRKPEQSKLEIRYSPTIAGSIVSALPYLAEYPYGCTEQTLNRFVPTVICQKLLLDLKVDLEAVRNQRVNLNPQEIGDDKERLAQWKRWQTNPVFNTATVADMANSGITRLTNMQNNDGGWGWFSGTSESSYPHTTAVVVHGLTLAKKNGAKVPQNILTQGINWLKRYEQRQVVELGKYTKNKKDGKSLASNLDAFLRMILAENDISNNKMQDFLIRDKNHFSLYGKSVLALALHYSKKTEQRDAVIKNIEQFLVFDEENQTAYLDLRNHNSWWYWYGSEFESQAWYLKLLALTKPNSKQARGLVKYLVNNRKHATYWNSTRDTAYCIEAIATYLKESGEFNPDSEVEVYFDNKLLKTVKISKENLFSFDNKCTIAGDILTTGEHKIEIRRKGKGPLYTNTYLTVFTKEDHITKTGLEVKVERRYYKITPDKNAETTVTGKYGNLVNQKKESFKKTLLKSGDLVKSGDLIEVELIMTSKNDYEYLLFADWKPAGCENKDVRSGYHPSALRPYMEVHDEKTAFFIRRLPRGTHTLTYQLRAEIPGKFSALPTTAEAMYAPELKANSDELKLHIED